MKILNIQLCEVSIGSLSEFPDFSCRVSIQGQVQVICLAQSSGFRLTKPTGSNMMHLVMQNESNILASKALKLEFFFTAELNQDFEGNVEVELSDQSITLISNGNLRASSTNLLSVKLKASLRKLIIQIEEGLSLFIDKGVDNEEIEQKDGNLRLEDYHSQEVDKFGEKEEVVIVKENLECEQIPNILTDKDRQHDYASEAKNNKIADSRKVTKCIYLNTIYEAQDNIIKINQIFIKLKSDLSSLFSKLIGESKSRESRSLSRSPTRRGINSGLVTPLSSQNSLNTSVISSFRVGEENTFEIFGNVNLDLDKLSTKNPHSLSLCIFGLLAKQSILHAKNSEISELASKIQSGEKMSNILISSIKASEHEFVKEAENINTFIQNLKDGNQYIKTSISQIARKNELLEHEKLICQQKLLEATKDSSTETKVDKNLMSELRSLSEACRKLSTGVEEKEDKIAKLVQEYNEFFKAANEYNSLLAEDKMRLKDELNRVQQDIDNLAFENLRIEKEMNSSALALYIEEDLRNSLELAGRKFDELKTCNSNIQTELVKARYFREVLLEESLCNLESFDKVTISTLKYQASAKQMVCLHSETISQLIKFFKTIKQEVSSIEDVYNKKLNIDKKFESCLEKLRQNEATTELALRELLYFSDFVLSFNHFNLQQKRITASIRKVLTGKIMEIEALKCAVSEIKVKNPVYLPLVDDIIDEAMAEFLNGRDTQLIIPFQRVSYGIYTYGSKKVMISLERGKLIAKSGGGFIPLENFINFFADSEVEKFEKRAEGGAKQKIVKTPRAWESKKDEWIKMLDVEERPETPIIEEDI